MNERLLKGIESGLRAGAYMMFPLANGGYKIEIVVGEYDYLYVSGKFTKHGTKITKFKSNYEVNSIEMHEIFKKLYFEIKKGGMKNE